MKDKFIIAKKVANQVVYFIWNRGSQEEAMEVNHREEAMNLTNKKAVLCAESNLNANRHSALKVC